MRDFRRRIPRLTAALTIAGGAIAFAPSDGRAAGEDRVFDRLPVDAADLGSYRWRNRLVLLFAPGDDDPAYVDQRAMLEAAAAGLVERDVIVLSDIAPAAGGALRSALGAQGFEVLLIGKDGGVKLRERTPVSARNLFATIDAMPMRRGEAGD